MSSLSTMLFQDEFGHMHSRKLLLHTYKNQQPASQAPSPSNPSSGHKFDANVVMILSVLLCVLICSLLLNSIIRCMLRCRRLVGSETSASLEGTSAGLPASGIKKKVLKSFQTVNFWHRLQLPGLGKECVICLSDFSKGETVKILPKCNHGFHVRCIDRWLSLHTTCPTCRHPLGDICQKSLTGGSCNSNGSSQPEMHGSSSMSSIVRILPLQQEGLIRNF
ncbi:hypothetical protein E3N88_23925 [Mikania micrantha]|uniref:RING-type E3 ubiquitin transferase n=1 Tax=Mikania micrantha TaxID=192012 RepID=A0A5N6NET9_9ASTR|nr:hypothetical protein E3N88_23925 [Mikania micrantha]